MFCCIRDDYFSDRFPKLQTHSLSNSIILVFFDNYFPEYTYSEYYWLRTICYNVLHQSGYSSALETSCCNFLRDQLTRSLMFTISWWRVKETETGSLDRARESETRDSTLVGGFFSSLVLWSEMEQATRQLWLKMVFRFQGYSNQFLFLVPWAEMEKKTRQLWLTIVFTFEGYSDQLWTWNKKNPISNNIIWIVLISFSFLWKCGRDNFTVLTLHHY